MNLCLKAQCEIDSDGWYDGKVFLNSGLERLTLNLLEKPLKIFVLFCEFK